MMGAVREQGVGVPAEGLLQQYGVIPWRKDRLGGMRVLLVTSRGRGRWIVPKGSLRKDRPPYLSAAMDAFVEAGVIGDILTHPLARYRYVREAAGGLLQYCHVTLFGLRVRGTLTNWPERAQRMRGWFDPEEAAGMVQNPELARAIYAIQSTKAASRVPACMHRHRLRGAETCC
ncbi:NUDIX hydrolase [Shinella fusca]|uniref:Putative NUDIX family NTP pyrophosphohydrolase n=1 Tax=Shinella fusca TaxID=544480 RepID=A0A7W7YZM0_9HYPH|nr:NUDIX hydrolase [Shinella fusca]MBB5045090.1 putative NUDIX family NTP pyrophosphohydrolase [Shinella fusca]